MLPVGDPGEDRIRANIKSRIEQFEKQGRTIRAISRWFDGELLRGRTVLAAKGLRPDEIDRRIARSNRLIDLELDTKCGIGYYGMMFAKVQNQSQAQPQVQNQSQNPFRVGGLPKPLLPSVQAVQYNQTLPPEPFLSSEDIYMTFRRDPIMSNMDTRQLERAEYWMLFQLGVPTLLISRYTSGDKNVIFARKPDDKYVDAS